MVLVLDFDFILCSSVINLSRVSLRADGNGTLVRGEVDVPSRILWADACGELVPDDDDCFCLEIFAEVESGFDPDAVELLDSTMVRIRCAVLFLDSDTVRVRCAVLSLDSDTV